MKKIALGGKRGQDKYLLIDNEKYDLVKKYSWYLSSYGYAIAHHLGKGKNYKKIYAHLLIINCPKGMEIDHINHNKLDNRRRNLRICTRSQNQMNKIKLKNNISGFTGVIWDKQNKKFRAQIQVNKKHFHLGLFETKEQAAEIYNQKAKYLFGQFFNIKKLGNL